ncbi:MAG: hypothetical protein LBK82_06750 [Planctomycetaceae bacterium]|jgi:hypothetical protein|nr:hypothetical protein [Planctomycetaceae bacterium]
MTIIDETKGTQTTTLVLVLLLGVSLGWCAFNMYGDRVNTRTPHRESETRLSRELDALNAQLRTTIDEQVKACRARGVNVYVTDPFPMIAEGIDIETTITLKIKYLNWQVEIVIALSRVSATPNPTPSPNPKPRPGSIGSVGEVGSTGYSDSLPRGLSIE